MTTHRGRAIVLAAHGSPDPRHARTVEEVVDALRAQGRDARVGWLGHGQPLLADAVAAAGRGAVVVPFLLAPAFHARVDVPAASGAAVVSDVLVPDPDAPDVRLVDALADRLAEAGARRPDGVILAAVGSRDLAHRAVVEGVGAALAQRLAVPVGTAYATAVPGVGDAVEALRDAGVAGPLAVASLFLAPGLLYDVVATAAHANGVLAVAEPLGAHPALLDLVSARVDSAG